MSKEIFTVMKETLQEFAPAYSTVA